MISFFIMTTQEREDELILYQEKKIVMGGFFSVENVI